MAVEGYLQLARTYQRYNPDEWNHLIELIADVLADFNDAKTANFNSKFKANGYLDPKVQESMPVAAAGVFQFLLTLRRGYYQRYDELSQDIKVLVDAAGTQGSTETFSDAYMPAYHAAIELVNSRLGYKKFIHRKGETAERPYSRKQRGGAAANAAIARSEQRRPGSKKSIGGGGQRPRAPVASSSTSVIAGGSNPLPATQAVAKAAVARSERKPPGSKKLSGKPAAGTQRLSARREEPPSRLELKAGGGPANPISDLTAEPLVEGENIDYWVQFRDGMQEALREKKRPAEAERRLNLRIKRAEEAIADLKKRGREYELALSLQKRYDTARREQPPPRLELKAGGGPAKPIRQEIHGESKPQATRRKFGAKSERPPSPEKEQEFKSWLKIASLSGMDGEQREPVRVFRRNQSAAGDRDAAGTSRENETMRLGMSQEEYEESLEAELEFYSQQAGGASGARTEGCASTGVV